MVTNQKVYGKAASMPAGIGSGVGVSMILLLVGCVVMGMLMENEVVLIENLGYGIMGVLLLSSIAGSWLACAMVKRRRLLVSVLQGVGFFAVLLLINGLLFGGSITGGLVTGLLLLAGSGVTALLGMRDMGKKKRKRTNHRTG